MNKLIRTAVLLVLGVVLMFGSGSGASAQSLWNDNSSGNLFGDIRARYVGDTLTIIINETSNASRTGSARNSKSASASADAGVGIFKFIAEASADSSDSFQAQGSINNTNRVTGRITVQVTEVMPNGNLAISGTQTINQNGEEQKITISGNVRPYDVRSDNTVLSNYVADAQLKIDGKGPISRKQKQGILTQIFNFLF